MSTPKNILLISHTFPPYPGIGGRRWAKFAKYLSREGYVVHVICAKSTFKEKSLWLEDVHGDKNIIVHSLFDLYPTTLSIRPTTLIQKLKYRTSLFLLKLYAKGTPYDLGIFWINPALKLAEELISKHKIKDVIVSSAPFSCAYNATKLKIRFSDLNLVVDFRDPWTWGTAYGFSNLNSRRRDYEERMELETVKKVDRIIVPVEIMAKHIINRYPEFSSKINILPHAFDADEVMEKSYLVKSEINIIFYGTLYEEIGCYFEEIIKSLNKETTKIKLDIYSDSKTYSELFENAGILNKSVFYHDLLPTKVLFKKIALADFVLLIHPDRGINNISTKFYEIIYSKTPIIYLSKPGLASDFVVKGNIGHFLKLEQVEADFCRIALKRLEYKTEFSVKDYSFESVTKKLIDNYLSHDR